MAANESGGSWMKVTLLGLLIVGCGVAMWATVRSTSQGLREPSDRTEVRGQRGGSSQSPEREQLGEWSRGEGQRAMAEQLDLTPSQRQQWDQARNRMAENPNLQPGEMFEAMQQFLTPEQIEQARAIREERGGAWREGREQRRAEREQQAREALSPAEFREWQERAAERRQQMAERMGDGRGGGGR